LALFLTAATGTSSQTCLCGNWQKRWAPHSLSTPGNITSTAPGHTDTPSTKLSSKRWTVIKQWRGGVKLKLNQRKEEGQGAKLHTKQSVNKHRKGSEDWERVGNKHSKPNCPTNLKKKQLTVIKHGQWRGQVEHWAYPREREWGKEINPQCWTLSKQTQQ
jgi:hypothetical protein